VKNSLPRGWSLARFGDLGTWTGGGTPSKSNPEFWADGTIPWVSPKDMKSALISDTIDRITPAALNDSPAAIVAPRSVLFVVRSGILRHTLPVAINSVPVTVNQDLKVLTPATGIHAEYVAWLVRSFEREILHYCSKAGTTVQSIEMPRLMDFLVPVAPEFEQPRIVAAIEEHLSRSDAAEASLYRIRALIARCRDAFLLSGIGGSLRNGESDRTKSWNSITMGEIAEIVTGTTPETSHAEYYGGEIPFFKPTDLNAGYNIRQASATLSATGAAKARVLPAGSVLVTCIGATIGKVGFSRVPGATNQQINALICGPRIDPRFLFWWFASPVGQALVRDNASATTLPILNKGRMKELRIELPPIRQQVEIVAEIERRMSQLESLDSVAATLLKRGGRLRQSILNHGFAGRLVPQDRGDEHAVLLLDRIRASRPATLSKSKSSRRSA
jgi:type I restriction enzyme, S subunit